MDKLKEVDWRGIYKTASQKVKKYTMNLTDLEIKVEEATSAETWGPHGSTMNEIADAAFDPENYRQIMGVLARRLQEKDENWRMCYKALLLLEHLLKHGPGKIVGDVQSSSGVLDRLTNFQYKDENMKDHGVNVRHRAKEIIDLVNTPERLRLERDKAKANRQKYRGVSSDQMRTGGQLGGGGSSFGRSSASDRFTSTTSASLHGTSSTSLGLGSSGSGYGGAAGGHGLGGGLGLGGTGGSYSMSRRTDSYDETEHDSHYISKRPGGASDAPAVGATSPAASSAAPAGEDAVAATRARIERLKVHEDKAAAEAAEFSKKKLTSVKVNPKIAASLGLKIPAPAAPRPASAPFPGAAPAAAPAPAAAAEIDLLGGLDEPAPAPAPAAAAPRAPAAVFDPFAAPAPAPASSQPAWDAFATAAPAPAAAHASPLDLLGGLGGSLAPIAAAPADPFAAFSAPAPALAPALPVMPTMPVSRPAAAPLPSVAAGVPAALPEDMFSDLTGIGKPQQPMGLQAAHSGPVAMAARGSGGSSGSGGKGGWGLPTAPPAPRGMSPPSPGGGFGDFGAAPPAFASGGMGMQQQQQQQGAPVHAHGNSGGSGGHSADFGSFSYNSAPQGGASAADPFADLLK